MTRRGDWIQTFTGGKFWPLDPRAEDVRIEDIAHALSNLCRFGGQCLTFYSVAQHSVLVAQLCPRPAAFWGLMHDASEAYLADVPRPLKAFLPGYKEAERAVENAIAERFGLPPQMPTDVKAIDNAMLAAEAEQLMAPPPAPWTDPAPPAAVTIRPWGPREAETRFLHAFRSLAAGAPV